MEMIEIEQFCQTLSTNRNQYKTAEHDQDEFGNIIYIHYTNVAFHIELISGKPENIKALIHTRKREDVVFARQAQEKIRNFLKNESSYKTKLLFSETIFLEEIADKVDEHLQRMIGVFCLTAVYSLYYMLFVLFGFTLERWHLLPLILPIITGVYFLIDDTEAGTFLLSVLFYIMIFLLWELEIKVPDLLFDLFWYISIPLFLWSVYVIVVHGGDKV